MDENGEPEPNRHPPAGLSVNFEYPHIAHCANVVHTDTIPIFVKVEWGTAPVGYDNAFGGVAGRLQLCPAIFAPSAQHIPQIVKQIYSRLASAATELDQGIPELLLSLVGTGCSLNFENTERLVRGLSRIVTRCGFWAITSGEIRDPLAAAAAASLRLTLPQRESAEDETLLIVVNSMDAVYNVNAGEQLAIGSSNGGTIPMIDSRYNTFYIIWNRHLPSQREMVDFRSCAAINLANPPPALLIGVPNVPTSPSNASFDERNHTVPQTPLGAQSGAFSPTIILPASSSAADSERVPLPVALFAGGTISSLVEVDNYLQCGVPVLVIHDVSELCALIKNCSILYQSAGFEHNHFLHWVDGELRRIYSLPPPPADLPMDPRDATFLPEDPVEAELESAKQILCRILVTSFHGGKQSLIGFMSIADADWLADNVMDLLAHAVSDNVSLQRVLNLAVKLNVSGVVKSLKLDGIFSRDEQIESILLEALKTNEQIDVMASLLDQNISIRVTSNLLLGWLEATPDQYFFNTIVLGHMLGFTYKLDRITVYVAVQINRLLKQLSGGVGCLFPVEYFDINPSTSGEMSGVVGSNSKSIQTLAVWALLLNRTETVRLLCAYAHEPVALHLILAKVSRNLARRSREWFFYEQKLLALSDHLSASAVQLLDGAYSECALRAYRALCHRPNLGSSSTTGAASAKWRSGSGATHVEACDCALNRLTLAELAFEMNAREFIAHDCCQRFVLRLLYGNLQVRAMSMDVLAPNWLKIVTSAVFVVPIAFWITIRPSHLPPAAVYSSAAQFDNMQANSEDLTVTPRRPLSPTVALLENGRQSKKIRANSIYSVYSMKSNYVYEAGSVVGSGIGSGGGGGGGCTQNDFSQSAPRTPDSITHETDMFMFGGAQRTPSTGTGSGAGAPSYAVRKKSSRSKKASEMIHKRAAPKSMVAAAASRAQRRIALHRRNNFGADVAMFYATPITKYWLSLIFRLAYLLLFSYTVALPSCGFLSIDFLVWIWSFMWLVESLWIFNVRLQNCSWREMPWTIFDIACVSGFLLYLLVARIVNGQLNDGSWISRLAGDWYTVKSVWALFLLYECYRTLFIYVPLSEVLGPLLVRIRLMVVHDFINYLILVLLVILSSAIAIKATLYPDLDLTASTLADSVSWSFLQLLTTDIGVLNSSEECQRKQLPVQSFVAEQRRCVPLSGVAAPRCPTPGAWPARFTVLEYLIVLKVISWPILFALFARTAKRVDESAQRIWRYQLYALATNFAIRPFLPPPFTPLFFVALSCCRLRGSARGGCRFIGTLIERLSANASDHPDVRGPAASSPTLSTHSKFSTVYRNPSVPLSEMKCQNVYWRQLSIHQWKAARRDAAALPLTNSHTQLDEKLNLLFLLNYFYRDVSRTSHLHPAAGPGIQLLTATEASVPRDTSYHGSFYPPTIGSQSEPTSPISVASTTATVNSPRRQSRSGFPEVRETLPPLGSTRRVAVSEDCRDWTILLPKYNPSFYSRPIGEFPREIQKYVQSQNLADIRRHWRQRRISELLLHQSAAQQPADSTGKIMLSGDGLPLNPQGRTGLAGRGDYTRFGPNRLYIYVIIVRDKAGFLKILTTADEKSANVVTLPNRWRYGRQRADEFLSKLLFLAGVSDTDSQMLTSRAHLAVGRADSRLAHVVCRPLAQPLVEMTDNAWTEADVWTADLRHLTEYTEVIDDNYEWRRMEAAATFLPACLCEFVNLSLRAFSTP